MTTWLRAIAMMVVTASLLNAQTSTGTRVFTLHDRLAIELSNQWTERRDVLPPPPAVLAASAPALRFSDYLELEHKEAPAILQFGFSDNPFEGLDAARLQTRLEIDRGAVQHLFFFFFPPPAGCLAQARADFERARTREISSRQQELARRAARAEKGERVNTSLGSLSASSRTVCEFAPTPRDLFASRISQAIRFRLSGSREIASGELSDFYLPAMQQDEIGGLTFFIFEAQDQRLLEFAEVERFGLAPEMNGARAYYFWAVGARTPFPFLRDPHRRDLQLVHVSYATLSTSGEARSQFLDLLRQVRFR